LLSSASLISEGSEVEVAIGVAHLPQPGTQLTARGTVLRVQPRATGDFSVSIAFERPFEFVSQSLGSNQQEKEPRLPQGTSKIVDNRSFHRELAWHTET